MKIKLTTITCGLVLALTATSALGRSTYVSRIPNGSVFSCDTCHTANMPDRNPFGLAFAASGRVWTNSLAALDSDGDRASNGLELGDPAGTWRPGSPNPSGPVYNPGDPSSTPPAATAPSITTQPQSQTVTEGANVSFTVVASGTAPLSYQWMKGGVNVTGGTAATLTLNSVTTAAAGSYTVRVSNSAGNVTSSAAILTVNPAAVAPAITTQPQSQTVTAGANVSFTVAATGTAPLSYQWMKDGANVTGGTAATLTLNSVTTAAAGSYTVRVSNSAANVTSSAAVLTVNPGVVAPAITTQPQSQTVTAGANVSFTVAATGTAPLSYQWMKDGANVTGGTAATLTLNSVTTAAAGSYTVRVSNSAGNVTSSAAILTINPVVVAPTITLQPVSQTVTAGANVSFGVAATGTAPLSYQWKKDGANVSGATSASLTLTSVTAADAGSYTVEVSNSAGSVTSTAATLTVNPAVLGIALTNPTNGATFLESAVITLEAAVTPSSGIAAVQFVADDTNVLGVVTTAPYTLAVSNLALGEHVIVAEVADNQGATAASEAVTISVVSAPPGGMTPVVAIIAPRNYSRFGAQANIELAARVVHSEPSVISVEFFSGSTHIGTGIPIRIEEEEEHDELDADDDERQGMPGTVYTMVWNRVPAGQYTITAKAICSVGGVGTSAPVRINVRGRGYEHDRPYGERDGDRD